MPDLAIRLGSREFDLANLLSAILPDDLESDVQATLDDPQRSLDLILDQLREQVPDKFQFLLSSIQDLTSHELNLFEVAESGSPTAAIGLELGAAASVRVRKLELDDGSDTALVGYGLLGNVSLGAAAKAASAVVSVGLNAGKESQTVLGRWQFDFLNKAFIKNPVSIELSVRDDEFKLEGELEDFFEPLQRVSCAPACQTMSCQRSLRAAPSRCATW